mgnify:CR=1 FL=1
MPTQSAVKPQVVSTSTSVKTGVEDRTNPNASQTQDLNRRADEKSTKVVRSIRGQVGTGLARCM